MDDFDYTGRSLRLRASKVPWDSSAFGVPVATIQELTVREPTAAMAEARDFFEWMDGQGVGVVSCRLPHTCLRESMFLERQGFRFIEMVLHPYSNIGKQQGLRDDVEDDLTIAEATEADVPELQDIAEHAFHHERFHVDPCLDPRLGNRRYGQWVANCLGHPTQRLLRVSHGENLVAFFIVEQPSETTAYWHLTAIAPRFQGMGYGRRVWHAMLAWHQGAGCVEVSTTISARNTRVLNLYASLGFRFSPPEMTFHWVRNCGT